METAQITREIRKQYKAEGIKASVRLAGGGISIRVSLSSGSFDRASEIAKSYRHVDYDESGEVLAGGNLYVFVEWSAEAISAKATEIAPRFLPALEGLAERAQTKLDGWWLCRNGCEILIHAPGSMTGTRAFNEQGALKMIARALLSDPELGQAN